MAQLPGYGRQQDSEIPYNFVGEIFYDSSLLYPGPQRLTSIKKYPLLTKTDFIEVTQLDILTLNSLLIPLQYTCHT